MPKFHPLEQTVQPRRLVHGGQALAELADGRKVFVWNALPGETVVANVFRQKRSYAEAVATDIITPAAERISPREANYLATSPWQIMTYAAENAAKPAIIRELFSQAGVALPDFSLQAPDNEWHYRNKMEYSFWGDEAGLHLALHKRGSHGKQIVDGSALALPALDAAARALLGQLQMMDVRAGDLKTMIVRVDQAGRAVAALFVKLTDFPDVPMPAELQGLRVYHSDPRSPASVPTALLREQGSVMLQGELAGRSFSYDVDSFFQVNLPIFNQALARIKQYVPAGPLTDMYAGVGSIGLSVANGPVDLVELDPATAAMARLNAAAQPEAQVIEASTERALDAIVADRPVIFDPPRAGLHPKVIARVLEVRPPHITYLSCNPATQARDLALLQAGYRLGQFEAFNFFPRTPHIESLAVLEKM